VQPSPPATRRYPRCQHAAPRLSPRRPPVVATPPDGGHVLVDVLDESPAATISKLVANALGSTVARLSSALATWSKASSTSLPLTHVAGYAVFAWFAPRSVMSWDEMSHGLVVAIPRLAPYLGGTT
jgi:type IV secretory pathway VirJ component